VTRAPTTFTVVLDGARSTYRLATGPAAGAPRRLADLVHRQASGGPAAVLVDRSVATAHPQLVQRLRARTGAGLALRIVPGGERAKTLDRLDQVYGWLARNTLPRDGLLVGVGGGALLDLVGLAASTWQRGVAFLAVPTTLLAMVDAAIGGKTAINTAGLKNPVGTFHPARIVAAEPGLLASLPRREWRNGLAELIKGAIIGSGRLFADLYRHRDRLADHIGHGPRTRPVPGLVEALPWADWIGRAARIKGRIVAADFRELGPRRALNLGHTLGHALEAAARNDDLPDNRRLSHGEAVAIGLAAVTRLAVHRHRCPPTDGHRILTLLQACGLPVTIQPPTEATLARLIGGDKKRLAGQVRWVLPAGIGQVLLDQQVTPQEILAAIPPDP